MEVGKRYWVKWAGPRADNSSHDAVGVYLGESEREHENGVRMVGWPGFERFKFDMDDGKIASIRKDRIEQFTEQD
jgi:signal recognition particle receptor subunit beta